MIFLKPIMLYDANIFSKMDLEDIKLYFEECDSYLTDDIVKELLEAKRKMEYNSKFQQKLDLIFNENLGLTDNLTLILSHVPLGLKNTWDNTKKIINPKGDPVICSLHHFWLREIISPALITEPYRHMNSLLTDDLKKGYVSSKEIQDATNKIRLKEIERANPYLRNSHIGAERLTRTWAKRNKDIANGTFKISDSRLIMHMFNLMCIKISNVILLTGDYDLIDLSNNLTASILDKYVINEVLFDKCMHMNLDTEKHTEIDIPISCFQEKHQKVLKKIEKSKDNISYTLWFFDSSENKIYPYMKQIPFWLLEFVMLYKQNLDCYTLDEETHKKYLLRYIWYSIPETNKESIRFEVWKKDIKKLSRVVSLSECKIHCRYEKEEINSPERIGGFLKPKKK